MKRSKHFKYIIIVVILTANYKLFSQGSNVSWDFPVKPGMTEWKTLKNSHEKIAACQIPDSILNSLSTSNLLELCLQYPLILDILTFNNILDGFEKYIRDFNGFQEYMKRDDTALILIKKYKELNPILIEEELLYKKKFDYAMRILMMEIFLCNSQILSRLNHVEKKGLMEEYQLKKYQKINSNEIYRYVGLQTINLAIIKLLESENVDLKQSINMDIVLPYITSGIIISPDVFKEIDNALMYYLSK